MNIPVSVCKCGKLHKEKKGLPQKLTCECGLMKWNGSTSTWADQETFDLRKQAHALFDPMWQSGKMTRKQAYEKLGFHFGQASKETLREWIKTNT